jgi:integrase
VLTQQELEQRRRLSRRIATGARACGAPVARTAPSDSLVFRAPNGGYVNLDNWRRRVWKTAMSHADLEYRPLYQMRHTFATLALAAGADLYWLSKQLGHESIRTTLKHYARFVPAVDERNLRALDDFAAQAAEDVSKTCHPSDVQ